MPTPTEAFATVASILGGVDPGNREGVSKFYRDEFQSLSPKVREAVFTWLVSINRPNAILDNFGRLVSAIFEASHGNVAHTAQGVSESGKISRDLEPLDDSALRAALDTYVERLSALGLRLDIKSDLRLLESWLQNVGVRCDPLFDPDLERWRAGQASSVFWLSLQDQNGAFSGCHAFGILHATGIGDLLRSGALFGRGKSSSIADHSDGPDDSWTLNGLDGTVALSGCAWLRKQSHPEVQRYLIGLGRILCVQNFDVDVFASILRIGLDASLIAQIDSFRHMMRVGVPIELKSLVSPYALWTTQIELLDAARKEFEHLENEPELQADDIEEVSEYVEGSDDLGEVQPRRLINTTD